MSDAPVDLNAAATAWLAEFGAALSAGDAAKAAAQINEHGFLRDLLTFSWDFRTRAGTEQIKSYLANSLAEAKVSNVQLDLRPGLAPTPFDMIPGLAGVDAAFTFETATAHGRGTFRILSPDKVHWQAQVVTMLVSDWKGHEEVANEAGVYANHTLSWEEVRAERVAETEKDPQVLILGAGQTGLQVAARLRNMGLRTIVIEKDARVGDLWRNRYPTLTLHTPRSHHSLLYQPFPSNWPIFTPRDKVASWLEQYAEHQDLVVWTSSTITGQPKYDTAAKRWTVTVDRAGKPVTLRPPHIVLATGIFGDPTVPKIPGLESFKGEHYHSSDFHGGKKHAGQRVVVVGSGNSAADICQDVAVRGAAKVTMVQRSPTVVVSDKVTAFRTAMAFPDGAPQDVIDLKNTGTPLALLRIIMVENQKWANMMDKDMHDGLKKAGFMVTDGPDGAGHLLRVYEKARGFFIDVGCSALIADGKVHVKPGQEITKITETSVVFADGEEIEADTIVWATGYDGPKPKWSRIFGEEVVDRIGEVWGMNEEGEVRAGYKPTGQPGLYFCGGDFAVSRMYTKQLGLYIRAIEAGLLKQ